MNLLILTLFSFSCCFAQIIDLGISYPAFKYIHSDQLNSHFGEQSYLGLGLGLDLFYNIDGSNFFIQNQLSFSQNMNISTGKDMSSIDGTLALNYRYAESFFSGLGFGYHKYSETPSGEIGYSFLGTGDQREDLEQFDQTSFIFRNGVFINKHFYLTLDYVLMLRNRDENAMGAFALSVGYLFGED